MGPTAQDLVQTQLREGAQAPLSSRLFLEPESVAKRQRILFLPAQAAVRNQRSILPRAILSRFRINTRRRLPLREPSAPLIHPSRPLTKATAQGFAGKTFHPSSQFIGWNPHLDTSRGCSSHGHPRPTLGTDWLRNIPSPPPPAECKHLGSNINACPWLRTQQPRRKAGGCGTVKAEGSSIPHLLPKRLCASAQGRTTHFSTGHFIGGGYSAAAGGAGVLSVWVTRSPSPTLQPAQASCLKAQPEHATADPVVVWELLDGACGDPGWGIRVWCLACTGTSGLMPHPAQSCAQNCTRQPLSKERRERALWAQSLSLHALALALQPTPRVPVTRQVRTLMEAPWQAVGELLGQVF